MRYVSILSLVWGCLLMSTPCSAVLLEIRGFHSQAKLTNKSSFIPALWSGSYTKDGAQETQSYRLAGQTAMNSAGQGFSLGFPIYPYIVFDAGLSQTIYFIRPEERIEELAPKVGMQLITNVQDRWMPFIRLGVSHRQMKLISNRIETRDVPPALGLGIQADRFGLQKQWTNRPQFWSGDIGVGCKFFLIATTSINLEYRYSSSFQTITIIEEEVGISSYRAEPGFISRSDRTQSRHNPQELSLGLVVDI